MVSGSQLETTAKGYESIRRVFGVIWLVAPRNDYCAKKGYYVIKEGDAVLYERIDAEARNEIRRFLSRRIEWVRELRRSESSRCLRSSV